MAQEPRLMAFEQALKDEGIAGTQLEPVARSIFQQESSSGKNVKTSNAGARGPMQVLPATFKAYNPQGNIDDPYDNSVGGLRYIKDLFSKTNDAGLTAVGYYGGPKAIEKAKAGVAVRDPRNPNAPDTLQYMEQVMGRTKGAPAGKRARPAVPKEIQTNAPELGPNYQAALALMAKADDLSEAREKIAEEDYANAGADFSQAKQMLAQIKPISGFVDQEPRRMASGGEVTNPIHNVQNFKSGGMVSSVIDRVAGSIKKVEPTPAAAEPLPPPPPEPYGFQRPTGPASQALVQWYNQRTGERFTAPSGGYTNPNKEWTDNPFRSYVAPSNLEDFVRPAAAYGIEGTSMQPVRYPSYTPPAMTGTPARTPIMQQFNTAAPYTFMNQGTRLMAEGGEAKKESPSMGENIKGTAKEILRSMQYAPYDLLGAPVDVINLGLKGVDYVTGSKLATNKPVGGSDYLIQKSRELGIADEPTGSTTETLTRLGTGIVSPTAGPKALALAAEKVAAKIAPKTTSRAQLDVVKAAEPVPVPAPPKITETPPAAPAIEARPEPSRTMYPDEIDPAVQREIFESASPPPAQKDRLFFGQIEKWTQSLSGKPTVQELKNRFSKVGRDYEINRLNLALEGKKPTDKVDAKELLETLKATSPQRYRTIINEPQEGKFYQGMDNPRPSSPLGTINLMEDVDPNAALSGSVAQQLESLRNIVTQPYYFSMRGPQDIKALSAYLKGPIINRPDLAGSVIKFEKDMAGLDKRVSDLLNDKDAHLYIYTGASRVNLDGGKEIRKAQDQLLPKILQENKLDPAKYEYNFQLPEAIRESLDKQVSELVSTKIGKAVAKKYGFPYRGISELETTMQNLYDQARLQRKIALTNAGSVYEDAINSAIKKLEAEAPYAGQHSSITGSANPVSFSRFMDIELPMVQNGKMKDLNGIFVTELQSDRLDDLRKFGVKGGSSYKDIEEYNKLDQQIDDVVRDARIFIGNRNFKDLDEVEQKKYFEFGIQENKLVQKQKQLRNRLEYLKENDPNLYGISEAFPGMADMPQVTQQLMIKNAVAAAIQRKNQFVLFPGADSAQPQLYEKLPNNVRTVVKDLGPGFEIKKVPMESENGDVVERIGIFWDDNAAKRVAKEGVRFAKGGLVDKNDLPDQKYI